MSPRWWVLFGGINAGLLVFNIVRLVTGGNQFLWFAIGVNLLTLLICWKGRQLAVRSAIRRQQFDREIEELMRRRGR